MKTTLGPLDVFLGAQWGDEGKGKTVDMIAPNYDAVARFQGGPNAGHTIYLGDVCKENKVVLHQIASGITADKPSLSGNGMVLDMVKFQKEAETVISRKPNACDHIKIARGAGIILPIHILLDVLNEVRSGKKSIGSTQCGIGPAYQDQIGRGGPKYYELFTTEGRKKCVELQKYYLPLVDQGMKDCMNAEALEKLCSLRYSLEEDLANCLSASLQLGKMVETVDCAAFLQDIFARGGRVLAEGAQGILLDQTYGMYPFVTSSITSTPGAALGLGLSIKEIGNVTGVFKAYCTRVGNGPFPTEYHPGLNGEYDESHGLGYQIQKTGNEFGSTTGRPRRCGRLDLPLLKRAVYLGNITRLVMTMIDVFNDFPEIEVCTGYENMAPDIWSRIEEAKPIIEKIPWGCRVDYGIRYVADLPRPAKHYIHLIEEYVGVPINLVSTGPGRDQMLGHYMVGGALLHAGAEPPVHL